jgi:transcriptional regulator with XRE-family HTH domain
MEHEARNSVTTLTARVKELRRARGWTGAELGERMTKLGVRWDRSIVANVEAGRRKAFTVDELMALAIVFDVAPVHLMVPLDEGPYQVTPEMEQPTARVRAWIRGEEPLPGGRKRSWFTERPLGELPPELKAEPDEDLDHIRKSYKESTGKELTNEKLLAAVYKLEDEETDGEHR